MLVDSDSEVIVGSLALWIGLEASVPPSVLDRFWFALSVRDAVSSARSLIRQGKPVQSVDVTVGGPIVDALDDRFEYRALVADQFNELAGAWWVPKASDRGGLAEIAASAGVSLSAIAEELGLPQTERLRLKRGTRVLRIEEAKKIAPLLRVTPDDVMATAIPIPTELVRALDRPRWKRHVLARARLDEQNEAETRRQVAYAACTQAARETAEPRTEAQWHARLEHVFAS